MSLHLSWNIAPGYYLYRHRIRVEALTPSPVGLRAIQLPQGIAHVDEHFGSVQIYRELLDADVPLAGKLQSPMRLRSEEHTSELQSLMRISYAVFCLKKQTQTQQPKHANI